MFLLLVLFFEVERLISPVRVPINVRVPRFLIITPILCGSGGVVGDVILFEISGVAVGKSNDAADTVSGWKIIKPIRRITARVPALAFQGIAEILLKHENLCARMPEA